MESVSHLPIRNCPISDFYTDEASMKTMHRIEGMSNEPIQVPVQEILTIEST